MPERRTARIGPTAWLVAGPALAGYAGAAVAALGLELDAPLPGAWLGVAAPPLVYVLVALSAIRRVSLARALAATGVLAAAHVLLLVLTGAAAALLTPGALGGHPLGAFGSGVLGVLALASVTVALSPLRPLFEARPRYSRGSRLAASPPAAAPAPARLPARPLGEAPPARPAPPPVVRPAAPVARPPAAWPAVRPPSPPKPLVPPAAVPAAASPTPAPPPGPQPATVPSARAAEPVEDVIRISFARIVDQLPADIFRLPRERVGANLLETDHLLIPERLVRPQLGDGLVQIGWPIVAEQFPRPALALPDEEIVRRLPNGSIVLPLDEVVRQLPADAFNLSAPSPDVRALEDFPPPFQPYVPPGAGEASEEEPPAIPETHPAPEAAMPAVEPAPVEPTALDPAAFDPAALDPAALDPTAVEPEAAEPAAVERAAIEPPAARPPAAPEPAPRTDPAPVIDARRLAGLLGPLMSPVAVEACPRQGATFLTLAPPAVAGAAVADVAARVLPFLRDSRLPEPALQATVRGTAMTAVITPLSGAPDAVLVAAATAGAALALLERLCLRAAAVPVPGGRRAGPPAPAALSGGELRETQAEPTVCAVAESLQAFGPVTPTVLCDPDGALIAYLFLPRGLEARALGSFARDLHRALAGSPVGTLSAVVLRLGGRRLLLRVVEAARTGRAVLVAGGGWVERPGMARLELERAAARLGRL